MSLKPARAAEIVAAIAAAFAEIGLSSPDTRMPRSTDNRSPAAWEFLVAAMLTKVAKKRKDVAVKKAITAGVMFDHKKAPHALCDAALIYDGDVVRIDLAVTPGRAGIDHDAFVAGLVKGGVKQALIDKLTRDCTTTTAAAHEFTASMVV